MSFCCPITVSFEVSKMEVLKEIARKYTVLMKSYADSDESGSEYDRDAHRFLEYAAEGQGIGMGPKGDMFTWGSVGNYTSVETFVDVLMPFWGELYSEHALMFGDGIVIMSQSEQRPSMKIVEISKDQTMPRDRTALVVRSMESPFPLLGWFVERPEELLPPGIRTEEWTGEGS